MKRNKTMTGLLVVALFALPVLSFASTYKFIDTSGNLQSVEAANSSIALATAYQLGVHSGVMLSGTATTNSTPVNNTPVSTGSGNYYRFIDTSGNIQGVWAANSSNALATAYQLGTHSGVVLSNNIIQ